MSKKTFIGGAAILAAAGIIVKILGFAFRIPLGRMIHAGGMGDYAPAYDVYAFILIIATAGIPVAISKMVSERYAVAKYKEAALVFRVSRKIMWGIGIIGFLVLFFASDHIAGLIKIESSALAIKAISPALLFAPLMSSYRGYFQGMQDMQPTAVSQIVEQFFRVAVGLMAAYCLYNGVILNSLNSTSDISDLAQAKGAAGACFGAAAGAFFGLLVMLIIYHMQKPDIERRIASDETEASIGTRLIVRQIIAISAPITIAACIMPLVNLADVAIVMRRLSDAGFTYAVSKSMFGELTSFAAPIMGFPQILVQAIVVSLVPLISATNKTGSKKELHENINSGYKVSMAITLPCSAGMFILAEPVLIMFFGQQVSNAVPCLKIYAAAFVFLSITSITTAMLQGLGKQNIPVINLFIGIIIKIIVTWFSSGIYSINVKGAAIGTMCAYITSAFLDVWALKKLTRVKICIRDVFAKPLAASLIMGAVVTGVYCLLLKLIGRMSIAALASILAGVAFYAVALVKGKVLGKEEIEEIPFGTILYRWIS